MKILPDFIKRHTAAGKDRFVILLPALGIVVKLPVIRFRVAIRTAWRNAKSRNWKALSYVLATWKPESHYVIPGMLLRGVISNIRERELWRRTRNPFLQPTYVSVCGLINIQRYGRPLEGGYLDLWDQIRRITNEGAYSNCHQFSEPGNYTLDGGRLRILDYGGHGSAPVVIRYGKRIQDGYDPEFRYSCRS